MNERKPLSEKTIIKQEESVLINTKYEKIVYEDGETVYRRFNEKYKMWVGLKFAPEGFDDSKVIESVIETAKRVLGSTPREISKPKAENIKMKKDIKNEKTNS